MLKMTLKALRVNAGMTQKEVAKALNKSNKTICNWENGVTSPNAEDCCAICELYKVSYDNINFFPNNSL